MYKWLEGCAYRVDISWHAFAFARISPVIVALVTISLQAFKNTIDSPVKTLKAA